MRPIRFLALLLTLCTILLLFLGCSEQNDSIKEEVIRDKESDLHEQSDSQAEESPLKDAELLRSIAYTPSSRKGDLRFTTSIVSDMADFEMAVEVVTTLAKDGRMRIETTMMGVNEVTIILPDDGTRYEIDASGEIAGLYPCDPALYMDEGTLYDMLVFSNEELISAQYEELNGTTAIYVSKKSGDDGIISLWYSPEYFVELQSEYQSNVRTTTTLVSLEELGSVEDDLFALPPVNPIDNALDGGNENEGAVDPRSELPTMEPGTGYYYTADEVQPVVYFIAMKAIKDAAGREFATSVEGMITLKAFDDDVCYLIRFSEETAEKSLAMGYYAVSANGPNIYLMDGVSGEYKKIGEMPHK